ncbi:MAG TPA: SDR family oxidoreductase [Acidobacteriota bacterium]
MNSAEKVILITGASSGIGKATAIITGKTRLPVIIAARRMDRLEQVAHEIESAGGKVLAVQTDIGDELQVAGMVDKALQHFGRIDVLINNAAIGLYATVDETTPLQMEKLWRVNYMGMFYCIKHVLPVMRKQQSGQIIVVASMSGRRGAAFKSAYCATKFAQIGFLESLRMELINTKIKCTLVFPGGTQTEFFDVIENPGNRDVKLYGSVQTADQVAEEILDAIKNPRTEVITQRLGRLQILLNAFSPDLADWMVGKYKK